MPKKTMAFAYRMDSNKTPNGYQIFAFWFRCAKLKKSPISSPIFHILQSYFTEYVTFFQKYPLTLRFIAKEKTSVRFDLEVENLEKL